MVSSSLLACAKLADPPTPWPAPVLQVTASSRPTKQYFEGLAALAGRMPLTFTLVVNGAAQAYKDQVVLAAPAQPTHASVDFLDPSSTTPFFVTHSIDHSCQQWSEPCLLFAL